MPPHAADHGTPRAPLFGSGAEFCKSKIHCRAHGRGQACTRERHGEIERPRAGGCGEVLQFKNRRTPSLQGHGDDAAISKLSEARWSASDVALVVVWGCSPSLRLFLRYPAGRATMPPSLHQSSSHLRRKAPRASCQQAGGFVKHPWKKCLDAVPQANAGIRRRESSSGIMTRRTRERSALMWDAYDLGTYEPKDPKLHEVTRPLRNSQSLTELSSELPFCSGPQSHAEDLCSQGGY